ncbi:hypothetical protein D9619_006488 [Psilocybe cf. subviscida]|uniref:Cytochrome P450 n=1 Tax=Psilocybe cf. subviscida TaxID=2480587 RepID=A0A8H5B4R7_9AGAR|nr:hypothetical protein D9619_006488 [Psilocybe cf. subviscida]
MFSESCRVDMGSLPVARQLTGVYRHPSFRCIKALVETPRSCTMLSLVLQLIAIYALSKILWRAVQKRFNPSVLDNLRGPAPSSFLTGCMEQLHDKNTGWAYHREIAAKFGGVMKIKGLFGEDQICTFDPKAMHHIFVKDQNIYEEHPLFISFSRLAYGEGLLGVLGDQHRKQRKMLNPVFSIAHMRDMVPIFYDVTRKVDLASFMTRAALELIGQAGIGYSFDTLEEDEPTHPYCKAAVGLMPSFYPLRFIAPFAAPLVRKYGNPKFCRFIMDLLPYKALHDCRDIVDVMDRTSREIFAQKKRALADGDEVLITKIGQGKDIMSILMRANMSASADDSLSETELLGQMTSLIFAAMDTTSNALSRVFHLLAQHPDIQERLRNELVEAREQSSGTDVPYDTLVHLPYLDAICRETLRMWSHWLAEWVDGSEITEIPVPKDTEILISLVSSNINPEIWGPDANEWKPERWLSHLPDSVKSAQIPGIYSHLGFKFSQLEMKVVICLLVEAFRFSPSKQDIIWHMNPVASPTIKGNDSLVPVMPIVVERI